MTDFEKPHRAPPLRQQIYEALRRQISEGTFPEDGVTELELSDMMQISRTPVREALFELGREGILVKAGHGFRLPDLDPDACREIAEIRQSLDPLMTRLAAERGGEALSRELALLHSELTRAHDANDALAFSVALSRFRRALMQAAGNDRLFSMMSLLDDQIMHLRVRAYAGQKARQQALDSHGTVFDALVLHDGKTAEAAMSDLIDFSVRTLVPLIQDRPAPTDVLS